MVWFRSRPSRLGPLAPATTGAVGRAERPTRLRPDRRPRDELIPPAQVAKALGYADTTTITHNVKRPPAFWPAPDDWQDLPSGRRRPLWKRSSIWTYAEHRKHPGHAGGRNRGSRTLPFRYASDPRLQTARDLLAEQPDALPTHLVDELQQRSGTTASRSTWLAEHPTDE